MVDECEMLMGQGFERHWERVVEGSVRGLCCAICIVLSCGVVGYFIRVILDKNDVDENGHKGIW